MKLILFEAFGSYGYEQELQRMSLNLQKTLFHNNIIDGAKLIYPFSPENRKMGMGTDEQRWTSPNISIVLLK